jgi:hypothetical protein
MRVLSYHVLLLSLGETDLNICLYMYVNVVITGKLGFQNRANVFCLSFFLLNDMSQGHELVNLGV